MKKNYILILLILFSYPLFSQTNLVTNGGFENWTNNTTLNDWTTENNVSRNSADFKEGNFSASLTVPNDNIKPKVFTKIPMENGVEYTVTFKYKYVDSNYGGMHPINLKIVKTGSSSTISSNRLATNNNWTTVVEKFTPDQTGDYDFSISTATYNGEGFNVLIDDVKVFDPNNTSNDIVTIPDANFKEALLSHIPTIDTNGDGEIQVSEAESFTNELNCSSKQIENLQGIESFINLKVLLCFKNNIKNIDVSKNTKLEMLYAGENLYTSIDVSKNILLKRLTVSESKITNIDISKNKNLEYFWCSKNQLKKLDVTNNPSLYYLIINNNELTNIDLSKNVVLNRLECQENKLQGIDISKNIALEYIDCEQNPLKNIDLSKNIALTSINCANTDLTSLNTSENINLSRLECDRNEITSLDIAKNKKLTYLICWQNKLTSLNTFNNTELKSLDIAYNKITTLDFSNNILLESLNIVFNKFTTVNLSKNINLSEIRCNNNSLTSLDISNNIKLRSLYIGANKLTSIDVSNNPKLTWFFCEENNLTKLNLKPIDNLYKFSAAKNENLKCIEVKDKNAAINNSNWLKETSTSYSENCSATANINDQTLNEAISIYPNPSKNFIKIKSNSLYKIYEIKLTTLLGKVMITSKKPELNISYLAEGIYLLKIKADNNKVAIKKFIKK